MTATGQQPIFLAHPVPPDLAGMVTRITGYEEKGEGLHHVSEAAAMVVPLVISFSDPFEIALSRSPAPDERYGSFTSGLHPGFVVINSTGAAQCVQIDFTPLGARRFFGLPLSEISGRMVTLDDLSDAGLMELRARLADQYSWDARLRLALEFVRNRIGQIETDLAAVGWAYDRLVGSGGRMRVRDLAAALGISRKHLNDRFRNAIGVGPKTVARMARFNRAIEITNKANSNGWADIAFAAGYADQAHFIREHREFAGTTPGRHSSPAGG
ncbi:MAG: AraC family transcriptional regulator [Rhizobiaceae bacterium]|nr:AraC family transcriptional regulator [Rhizobiaceae bacterium]